jgi:hypothetical protein
VAKGDSLALILSRNAAGWHQLLDKLEARLAGQERPSTGDEHQKLLARYAAMID